MATYNGERFIAEQIASIQGQMFQDWVLIVRDDGSNDRTCQIVSEMAQQDGRIKLLTDGLGNRGAIGNFAALMQTALKDGVDYLFLADQDDVWLPDKLSLMLSAMCEMESKSPNLPLLVHCDLEVVDKELRTIARSFTQFSRLAPTSADLGVLLCQNQVTGCACLINRSLLALACPVPSDVLMHDWWLALLAASSGKIGFVPMPLVRYRQHGGNVLGAVSFGRRLWQFFSSSRQWMRHIAVIKGGIWQSRLLVERLNERDLMLSDRLLEQICAYSNILQSRPLSRVAVLRQYGIGKSVLRTRVIFAILLLLMPNDFERKQVA